MNDTHIIKLLISSVFCAIRWRKQKKKEDTDVMTLRTGITENKKTMFFRFSLHRSPMAEVMNENIIL